MFVYSHNKLSVWSQRFCEKCHKFLSKRQLKYCSECAKIVYKEQCKVCNDKRGAGYMKEYRHRKGINVIYYGGKK
jgi:cytochrome c